MKKIKYAIYYGILATTLLAGIQVSTTQVHAEEETSTAKFSEGSIGELVWKDVNQNGIQDPEENGVEGIIIELYRTDGSKLAETKTDKNGFYQFNSLPEGDYFAHIVIPQDEYKIVSTKLFGWDGYTGYLQIKGDVDNKLTANVGLISKQKGNIVSTIWEEINPNGIQDEYENGISNITVDLYTIYGEKMKTSSTNMMGLYQFSNIPNGYYYIKLQVPEEYVFWGATNFGKDQFSNYIFINENTNTEMGAGYLKKQEDPWENSLCGTEESCGIIY
ncbi:hypothetical protein FC694_03140 [Bacillus wiedmannii]|uniref:SD-repeat containing protein B domain-containing protein n=1 Tax=Bacillus wiedmannii TaxID=1890302 RepID=A0A4U2N3R6_9BACI|nr:SdrD B-like domain-containing protein [Bacillus wiedmannii]TKH18977.1 hypothetical protein FC694_03140 [Bacillus wiedmannii]